MSFDPGPLEVREGDAVEIRVRYQVRSLDAPLHLGVSPLPLTASDEDFELSAPTVEIPAGEGVTGEALLELMALEDRAFDEGSEAVALRFVPGGVNARLGGDARVVIQDAGVSPCPGISVVATRPAPGGPNEFFVQRFLTVRTSVPRESLAMEFLGPYRTPPPDFVAGLPRRNTNFAVNIGMLAVETGAGTIRHTLDIQLPRGLAEDPDLRLAFRGEGCRAEGVNCSLENCELTP